MARLLTIWRGWTPRQRMLAGLAAGLAVAGIVLAGYLILKRPGDVSNPDAEFKTEKPERQEKTVNVTLFGNDPQRTKYLPVKGVEPPYRQLWRYDSGFLLEFPPIVVNGVIYGMNDEAKVFALKAKTGKVIWEKQPGRLSASTPTYYKGVLYAVNLEPGQAFAMRAKDGKLLWRRPLPGRAESSPVVYKGRVIFGVETGDVFALDPKNGKVIWQTPLSGEVKAAPAVQDGTVYVGDYGGNMYGIRAKDGEIRWQTGDLGSSFGRSGRFYSTPAVAFGRVYAGNVDGRVYSFEASDGDIAWTHSTGDWVYGGLVAADPPGSKPAIFAGSFDHNVYALDARDGGVLWSKDLNSIISGAGTAIGRTYYVSTIGGRTYGFNMKTGKEVFEVDRGQYSPGISDGQRFYQVGASYITGMAPKGKKGSKKGSGKSGGGKKEQDSAEG